MPPLGYPCPARSARARGMRSSVAAAAQWRLPPQDNGGTWPFRIYGCAFAASRAEVRSFFADFSGSEISLVGVCTTQRYKSPEFETNSDIHLGSRTIGLPGSLQIVNRGGARESMLECERGPSTSPVREIVTCLLSGNRLHIQVREGSKVNWCLERSSPNPVIVTR